MWPDEIGNMWPDEKGRRVKGEKHIAEKIFYWQTRNAATQRAGMDGRL